MNLNYLNETETVAQASLIVSHSLTNLSRSCCSYAVYHSMQFDTFYGTRKNITSHLKLELMEIGNEVR